GNITYVLMNNLGYELGLALHTTQSGAQSVGIWFARITGLSMFLAYTGGFFTLIYSPLKTLIQLTPQEVRPTTITKINQHGIAANARWAQCIMVAVIIMLTSFGGSGASAFYNKLTLMANVSMTLPILFLAVAFPFFKNKKGLTRPFVIFKSKA